MVKVNSIIILACMFALFYLVLKPNFEEKYQNNKQEEKPDDLFSDGLDHNLGLNKKHRHHSF